MERWAQATALAVLVRNRHSVTSVNWNAFCISLVKTQTHRSLKRIGLTQRDDNDGRQSHAIAVVPRTARTGTTMKLFKHLLVPLDFTRKNNAALRVALNLARQNSARVTLLHVIETIDYAVDEEIAEFYETLKTRAEANLADCAERFKEAKVPVTQKIVMGKTARGIVSYALRRGIDLVVLSSHKVKLNQAPKGWATLSYQVSLLCQCPVMLVK